MLEYLYGKILARKHHEPIGSGYFRAKLFPYKYSNFLKPSHSSYLSAYENGTECSETLAYKIHTPGNYPKQSIQHDVNILLCTKSKFVEKNIAQKLASYIRECRCIVGIDISALGVNKNEKCFCLSSLWILYSFYVDRGSLLRLPQSSDVLKFLKLLTVSFSVTAWTD